MHNSSFYRIGETNSRHGFGRLPSLLLCSVLVLSILMLSGTLGRGENVLANGSFESPLLATNSQLWLSNGDPRLTGWTIAGAAGTLALENGFLPGTIGPVDGAQCLVFDGGMNPTGTSISQTFDTEVGQAYVVSFKVGKEGGAPGNMQITATVTGSAGVVLGSLAGSQSTAGWGPTEAFFFTATTAASTLTLVDTSSTTIDTDVALDNVSVLPIGPITNGLVAYYPFNGNANDESGNTNNGIVHGALLTTNRFGDANSAYVFDGISAYIETINSLPDMPSASVSFWVNVPASGQADQYIFMDGDQTNAKDFVAHWGNNDTLGVCTKDNSCVGLGLPLTNTWFHVAAVANGNTKNLRIWLNGQQVATSSSLGNANVGYHSKLDIGCRAMLYDHFFKGAIDDLRFYSRALSDSEVEQLYLHESGVPVITSQPQSRTVAAGSSLQFSVRAGGAPPISYQWRKGGVAIPGFTDSTCTCAGVFTNDAGAYSVVVSNGFGAIASADATLTIRSLTTPPVLGGPITNQANGHLYFLLGTGSWVEAEAAAVSLGGHLATVRNQAENDWIYATFGNFQGIRRDLLVGLFDGDPLLNSTNPVVRQGEFAWVSGEPVAYTCWWTNEPSNFLDLGAFYGMIWGFGGVAGGHWNDISDDLGPFNQGLAEVTLSPNLVTVQPEDRTIVATSSASFAANVSGLPPLTYRWLRGGQPLPDATNRVCTIVGIRPSDAGAYTLVVSNAFGAVTGLVATLTVLPLTPPTILTGPITNPANEHLYYLLDQSAWVEAEAAAVALGGHLATIRSQAEQDWVYSTFGTYRGVARNLYIGLYDADPVHNSTIRGERMSEFVWVSGEPVSYANWYPSEPNNYLETGESYGHMVNPVVQHYDRYGAWPGSWNDQYAGSGWPISGVAEVIVPPSITVQPTNQWTLAGSNIVLAVNATGSTPITYQWQLNGTNLPGATSNVLNLASVGARNSGTYVVVVSNSAAAVNSTPALLDVRYALAYGNGGLLLGSNYTFIGSVDLELWSVFPNGNIFYTLDGSEPSFASSYYAGPFNLNRTAILRVIAYSADFLQAGDSPPIFFTVIPTYALNLTSPGGGTVTASPPVGPYVSNTVVTLTPQPSNGWMFLEWRGDASGASPTVALTMNRAKTVQAIFGTILSTTVAGNGAVNVYPSLPLYPHGTVARLTAIPQAGNYFAVWGNAASGNTNPLYFTVTSAAPTVSSLFAALGASQHALTVIPDGFGRVTATPRADVYATGASVSLNAIPDPGQQFLAWSGDAAGTQNPLTLSINTSKTVTATFTRKPSLAVAPPLGGFFGEGFRFTLQGEFGQTYQIDASTNLADWGPLTILTNAYGTVQFTDESATNAAVRFYRASALTP